MSNKDDENKKISLNIALSNFGPIIEGNVTIKPLTIFIGPNNSGKSYTSMLIHSIFESYYPIFPRGYPLSFRRRLFRGFETDSIFKDFPELRKQIDSLKQMKEIVISINFINSIINRIVEEIYEKRLSAEIIRSFACTLSDLVSLGKKKFKINLSYDSNEILLDFTKIKKKSPIKEKLNIISYPKSNYVIKLKYKKFNRPKINIIERPNEIIIEVGGFDVIISEKKKIGYQLLANIYDVIFRKIIGGISFPCYYLPAARSGILQGHKALSASIVRKAPFVGIEDLEIPKFSGVVSDFISSIISLEEEKGPFFHIAQEFENEIIKGEIVVRYSDDISYPEIKYKFRNAEISLHRASSTVSELAPFFLYLKYVLEPGYILIIEEPEAHLHPENQRILVKYIIKLIRAGVNIIMTTHSEFILEQLSSFIMLSKITEEQRIEKFKYKKEDYLDFNEIATYVFVYESNKKGFRINNVKITQEDGISQEEFIKIHDALYEETIKLRRTLTNKSK